MRKSVIILVILTIVLAVGVYFLVKNYQPNQKEYFNVSISAIYDKERVITGYEIDGYNGKTSKSYELISLEKGEYTIRNVNLPGQNFYEEPRNYNVTENTRIDLKLKKPEKLKIKIEGSNPIILNISSISFRDAKFCLKGSARYIFVVPEPRQNIEFVNLSKNGEYSQIKSSKYNPNEWKDYQIVNHFNDIDPYEEIPKLEGFTDYERCYNGDFSLDNSFYALNISYDTIGSTSSTDFINIVLLDSLGNNHVEKIK